MNGQARQALFISHASPEDNAFTLWLGAKLTALGYEVFADVLRLKGGDDWERILESAIRDKAAKFLLAATPHGVQKQGVRNEITIATETAKRINDKAFIVPLRLAPFDAPLQIAHAQYIDFSKGWAPGLGDLLTLLSEAAIPKSGDAANAGALARRPAQERADRIERPPNVSSPTGCPSRPCPSASFSMISRAASPSARRKKPSRNCRYPSLPSIAAFCRSRRCINYRSISVPTCRSNALTTA